MVSRAFLLSSEQVNVWYFVGEMWERKQVTHKEKQGSDCARYGGARTVARMERVCAGSLEPVPDAQGCRQRCCTTSQRLWAEDRSV